MTPTSSLRLKACLYVFGLAAALLAGPSATAQTPALAPSAAASATQTPASTVLNTIAVPIPNVAASAITPPTGDTAPANPYGLRSVWGQGDGVTKGTLLILVVMSLLSWYLIVAKLLEQHRLGSQAQSAKRTFVGSESLRKRSESLDATSPFRFIVDSALEASRRHEYLASQVDMASWLTQDIVRAVGTLQMRTQEGLSVLATVGSTAPFVGLFGTVWGIYNALVTIGVSGQASIDKVAGPVGEALIMTALGLAVAVPAVLGYNWLVRRNRVLLHAVRGFGSELHTQLLVEVEKTPRPTPVAQKSA